MIYTLNFKAVVRYTARIFILCYPSSSMLHCHCGGGLDLHGSEEVKKKKVFLSKCVTQVSLRRHFHPSGPWLTFCLSAGRIPASL